MPDYDVRAVRLSQPPQLAPVARYRPAVAVENRGRFSADISGLLRIYDGTTGRLLASFALAALAIPPGETRNAEANGYWQPETADIGKQFIFCATVTTYHDQIPYNNNLPPTTVTVTEATPPTPPPVQAHAAQHERTGTDRINVAGLYGVLAEPQDPTAHAQAHERGGSDELDLTGLHGQLADPQQVARHGNDKHVVTYLSLTELNQHNTSTNPHSNVLNPHFTGADVHAAAFTAHNADDAAHAAAIAAQVPTIVDRRVQDHDLSQESHATKFSLHDGDANAHAAAIAAHAAERYTHANLTPRLEGCSYLEDPSEDWFTVNPFGIATLGQQTLIEQPASYSVRVGVCCRFKGQATAPRFGNVLIRLTVTIDGVPASYDFLNQMESSIADPDVWTHLTMHPCWNIGFVHMSHQCNIFWQVQNLTNLPLRVFCSGTYYVQNVWRVF